SLFFLCCSDYTRYLHSFPTRRSSDLVPARLFRHAHKPPYQTRKADLTTHFPINRAFVLSEYTTHRRNMQVFWKKSCPAPCRHPLPDGLYCGTRTYFSLWMQKGYHHAEF